MGMPCYIYSINRAVHQILDVNSNLPLGALVHPTVYRNDVAVRRSQRDCRRPGCSDGTGVSLPKVLAKRICAIQSEGCSARGRLRDAAICYYS